MMTIRRRRERVRSVFRPCPIRRRRRQTLPETLAQGESLSGIDCRASHIGHHPPLIAAKLLGLSAKTVLAWPTGCF